MSVNVLKSPQLMATLLAMGYLTTVLTSCSASERLPNTPTVTASAATPSSFSDLLRPLSIHRDQIITYPQGVVVNLTPGVDLGVIVANLRMVNTDPRFGLNFTEEDQNITYFFPQSFIQGNGREEAIALVEQQRLLVLTAFAQEQNIGKGRVRFSIISVADALTTVSHQAPRQLTENDPFWQSALNVESGNAYLGMTRARIFDISQTPQVYPAIPPELRRSLAENLAYPFAFQVHPNYLRALGLVPTRFYLVSITFLILIQFGYESSFTTEGCPCA